MHGANNAISITQTRWARRELKEAGSGVILLLVADEPGGPPTGDLHPQFLTQHTNRLPQL